MELRLGVGAAQNQKTSHNCALIYAVSPVLMVHSIPSRAVRTRGLGPRKVKDAFHGKKTRVERERLLRADQFKEEEIQVFQEVGTA